ncbi:stress response protein NST1-like [Pyrus ussuriensis x Pyrus communis]|uniref:Stress response protein NST1-like n=1 Tax=Pyrus ussuriensis x Pyrus communis TaxID=2448454 RepID=A0A5N5FLF4_9ROSA|nr:stress response protein NST1-like [Pyrus ussuriensis x Pyrus communis]
MRRREMSQVRYKECNLLRGNDFVFLAYRTVYMLMPNLLTRETANKKMEEEGGFDNSRSISETEPSTSRISISNIVLEEKVLSTKCSTRPPFKEKATYTQQEIDALRIEWAEYVDDFIPIDETLD